MEPTCGQIRRERRAGQRRRALACAAGAEPRAENRCLPIFEHGEHLPFDAREHPARMDGRRGRHEEASRGRLQRPLQRAPSGRRNSINGRAHADEPPSHVAAETAPGARPASYCNAPDMISSKAPTNSPDEPQVQPRRRAPQLVLGTNADRASYGRRLPSS